MPEFNKKKENEVEKYQYCRSDYNKRNYEKTESVASKEIKAAKVGYENEWQKTSKQTQKPSGTMFNLKQKLGMQWVA